MFHSAVIDRLLDLVPVADLGAKAACVHANGLDIPAIGINLDSRPDKWRTLQERMSAIGFDRLMRARAVEGAKLPDELIEQLLGRPAREIETPPEDHLRLTRPAIGCFLSHLSIWRWMQVNGIEQAIVFEDDARPAQLMKGGQDPAPEPKGRRTGDPPLQRQRTRGDEAPGFHSEAERSKTNRLFRPS